MAGEKDIWASVTPRFKKGCVPKVECGLGWQPLVLKLCGALDKIWDGYDDLITGKDCWHILQVKEKMGALVMHAEIAMKTVTGELPKVFENHKVRTANFNALIDGARFKSTEICEECGESGRKRFLIGAYKTLCDRCFVKWEEERTSAV
jgi:hypothetical protein